MPLEQYASRDHQGSPSDIHALTAMSCECLPEQPLAAAKRSLGQNSGEPAPQVPALDADRGGPRDSADGNRLGAAAGAEGPASIGGRVTAHAGEHRQPGR